MTLPQPPLIPRPEDSYSHKYTTPKTRDEMVFNPQCSGVPTPGTVTPPPVTPPPNVVPPVVPPVNNTNYTPLDPTVPVTPRNDTKTTCDAAINQAQCAGVVNVPVR